MLDTIRLGWSDVDLDGGKLLRLGWTRAQYEKDATEGVTEVRESFGLRRENESPHFLAYFPGSGRLKAEMSFPKLLYHDNVAMLRAEDVGRGLDRLSEIMTVCAGQPVDARAGQVQGRVDFVFSYDTRWGDRGHVDDYLDAMRSLELPRHYSQSVSRDATLYWRNASRVIRLYDKFRESGVESARGNLRFEVQENHAKAALERLVPGVTLGVEDVMRWDVAKKVLGTYLSALGADLVVSDERRLAESLVEAVGPTRARRLMGYVALTRLFGQSEMVRLGFNRKTAWRDRREIQKVGLSSALAADGSGLLPSLGLPETYSGEPMKLGI